MQHGKESQFVLIPLKGYFYCPPRLPHSGFLELGSWFAFQTMAWALLQYSAELQVKWNTAVTFLIPLTFYNLGNLTQQQEFNHIHWCKRQNKAPFNSEGAVTSKVSGTPELFICVFLMLHHPIMGCHVYPLLILELIGYKLLLLVRILTLTCQNCDILCAPSLSIYSEWYSFKGVQIFDFILKMYPVTLVLCSTTGHLYRMLGAKHTFVYTVSNDRGTDSLNQVEWFVSSLVGVAGPNHFTKCHSMCVLVLGLNCCAVGLMDEIA